MSWVFWLVVIAFFVIRGLINAAKPGGVTGRARHTARQAGHELRQQARQVSQRRQPTREPRPGTPPAAWQPGVAVADWSPSPPPLAQQKPARVVVATSASDVRSRFEDLREAAREAAEPIPSQLGALAPARGYVGSAALESTLDSTIESSLFGVTTGPLASSVLPGTPGPTLSGELEAQVRAYLNARHEVAAVRLVCDELDVGILDALRAVRSVAGLPAF